jgi:hypothetical protein
MSGLSFNESEICAALRVLFPDTGNQAEILGALRPSELKSAYRKMALQIHPDRVAFCSDVCREGSCGTFIEVKHAYEILNEYLRSNAGTFCAGRQGSETGRSFTGHRQFRSMQRGPAAHSEIGFHGFIKRSLYQGNAPRRSLRFGEFLYYSGLIPWQALTRALVWQRKHRPRIGEIAQGWRWLTELQVVGLIRNGRRGDFLGALLLRNRILSPIQLRALLWEQKKFRRPIGRYFLLQKLLTESQIQDLLRRQRIHNLQS